MPSNFKSVEKCAPSIIVNSSHWLKENYFAKYEIPDTPGEPNGKGIDAGFETILRELYDHQAHMVGFRIESKQRLIQWACAIAYRYDFQFGELDRYLVHWTDKKRQNNEVIDEIQLQILEKPSERKIITVHKFFTTYLITVQGNHHQQWVDDEFDYLKKVVNYASNVPTRTPNSQPLVNSEDDTFVKTHATTLATNTHSPNPEPLPTPTNPRGRTTSTHEHQHTDLQALERSLCETVTNLESKLESFIEKTDEKQNTIKNLESKFETFMKNTNEEIKNLKTKVNDNDSKTVRKMNDLQRDTNAEIADVKISVRKTQTELESMKQESKTAIISLKEQIHDLIRQQTDLRERNDMQIDISTSNRFELLQDTGNTSVKGIDTNSGEDDNSRNSSLSEHEQTSGRQNVNGSNSQPQDTHPKNHQVLMLFDSHGNDLVANKMYKNKDIQIEVLGQSKKTINGAKEYLDNRRNKSEHILLCVGSNDLATKSVDNTIRDMQNLLSNHADPDVAVHIFPAIERVDSPKFNQKVTDYNDKLYVLCANYMNCSVIDLHNIAASSRNLFAKDGIHFNFKGRKELVKCIKTHLNPALGMKPYSEYVFDKSSGNQSDFRNDTNHTPAWDPRGPRTSRFVPNHTG